MNCRLSILAAAVFAACSQPKQQSKAPTPEPRYFKVDLANAGVISGKVVYTGKLPPPKTINIDEDEKCVALNKAGLFDESLVTNKNRTLPNVFVYIKQGLEGKAFERSQAAVVLDQKGCRFVPRVLGIQTGQILEVTNSDPVTHNVHPVAKMNREWNQSQSPGDPPLERRFARPEVMVRVKCNVHSWMRSWVGVLGHPYFAVTGADGSFEIPRLPPGDYMLEAWQESLGAQEQRVHIEPRGHATAVFKFDGGQL